LIRDLLRVETHPTYVSGDGSFTSPPCGLAVSYDLINLVKKLHKVHKNPEHALDVIKGDPANFFRFHRFGIKEFAEAGRRQTATARTKGQTSGGSLFFTELKFTAKCGEIVSVFQLRCLNQGHLEKGMLAGDASFACC